MTSRRGVVATLVLISAGALVALLWTAMRLQLRLTVDAPAARTAGAQLLIDEVPVPLRAAPGLHGQRLVLSQVLPEDGAAPGEVIVAGASTDHYGIVPPGDFTTGGGWQLSAERGEWISRGAGGELAWEALSTGLLLRLRTGPGGGQLRIVWNGSEQLVSTAAEAPGEKRVHLPSARTVLHAQLSPWARTVRVTPELEAPAQLALVFGNEVLHERRWAPGEPIGTTVTGAMRASVARQVLSHLATLFGRSLLLLAVYLLVGVLLLGALLPRLGGLERWGAAVAVGYSVLTLVTTTLGYALPVRFALPVALALLVLPALILQRARLRSIAGAMSRGWREDGGQGWLLVGVGVLSTLFFFFPILLEGEWYFAQAYTDVSWYYVNLAEGFRTARPLGAMPHNMMSRWSDLVSLSASSLLLGSDTREAFGPHGASLWLALPLSAAALFHRLGLRRLTAVTGAVLVAFSANFHALFTQCYLAQYVFMFSLLWGLAFTALCLQLSPGLGRLERWTLWCTTAAIYAFNVSLYPFQFLLPLAWAFAVLVLWRREGGRQRVFELFTVGGLTLLFLNVNVSVLLYFPQVKAWHGDFAQLNGLARGMLFPFMFEPSFAAMALGLRDVVLNSRLLPEIFAEALNLGGGGAPLAALQSGYGSLARVWTGLGGALILLGVVGYALRRASTDVFLGFVALLYAAFTIYLALSGEAYAYSKLVLSLGVLALVPLVQGLDRVLTWKWQRPALLAGGAFAAGFLALNLLTAVLENAPFLLNRKSELLYSLRTHVRDIDLPLKQLAAALELEREKAGRDLCLERVGRYVDREGTDGDRLVYWRVDHLKQILGSRCEATDPLRYQVVLPRPSEPPPGEASLVFGQDFVKLYRMTASVNEP